MSLELNQVSHKHKTSGDMICKSLIQDNRLSRLTKLRAFQDTTVTLVSHAVISTTMSL